MGNDVKKSTMVRNALKEVLGKEKYANMAGAHIFADTRSGGKVRVKVQDSWAGVLTEDEAQQVVVFVREHYGEEVEVSTGVGGSRHAHYTAFTL